MVSNQLWLRISSIYRTNQFNLDSTPQHCTVVLVNLLTYNYIKRRFAHCFAARMLFYTKKLLSSELDLLQYSASFLWADSIQIDFHEQLLTWLIQNHPWDELMHQALHISYCRIWNSAKNLYRAIRNLGGLVSNSKHTYLQSHVNILQQFLTVILIYIHNS